MSRMTFQTLRSGSSGNCIMIATPDVRLLFDCGVPSQRECRSVLETAGGPLGKVDAVLVSHLHSDHIGYPALRTLARQGIPIHTHDQVYRHVRNTFDVRQWDPSLSVHRWEETIGFGDLKVRAIPVKHAPGCDNVGFIVEAAGLKIVLSTDLCDASPLETELLDADFVYLESNYDPELLRQKPNWASRWHLSNKAAARCLASARAQRDKPWQGVMLGHLSAERNTPELAIGELRDACEDAGVGLDFEVRAAPRFVASEQIMIEA